MGNGTIQKLFCRILKSAEIKRLHCAKDCIALVNSNSDNGKSPNRKSTEGGSNNNNSDNNGGMDHSAYRLPI